jgi:hypothetical protein
MKQVAINTYRTSRRYIPEDTALHIHHCENLKSNNIVTCRIVTIEGFWIG